MATEQRSASGSAAMITSAPRSRASANARSRAPSSSGLGKATVGKSGSGANCSSTTATSVNPASRSTRVMVSPPTPCIGVTTIRVAARSAGSDDDARDVARAT